MSYENITLEEFRKLSDKEASKVPRATLERLFDEVRLDNEGWVYDQQRAKLLSSL